MQPLPPRRRNRPNTMSDTDDPTTRRSVDWLLLPEELLMLCFILPMGPTALCVCQATCRAFRCIVQRLLDAYPLLHSAGTNETCETQRLCLLPLSAPCFESRDQARFVRRLICRIKDFELFGCVRVISYWEYALAERLEDRLHALTIHAPLVRSSNFMKLHTLTVDICRTFYTSLVDDICSASRSGCYPQLKHLHIYNPSICDANCLKILECAPLSHALASLKIRLRNETYMETVDQLQNQCESVLTSDSRVLSRLVSFVLLGRNLTGASQSAFSKAVLTHRSVEHVRIDCGLRASSHVASLLRHMDCSSLLKLEIWGGTLTHDLYEWRGAHFPHVNQIDFGLLYPSGFFQIVSCPKLSRVKLRMPNISDNEFKHILRDLLLVETSCHLSVDASGLAYITERMVLRAAQAYRVSLSLFRNGTSLHVIVHDDVPNAANGEKPRLLSVCASSGGGSCLCSRRSRMFSGAHW